MRRLRGLFILDPATFDLVYGPQERMGIARHVDMVAPPQTRDSIAANLGLLNSVEAIFSSWTPPTLSDEFFDAAPDLKAIFHAAGALALPERARRRGLMLTNAHIANSIPVAEYTLAVIIFSLKHGWRLAAQTRRQRTFVERNDVPGCFGTTVGLISLGTIARLLLKLLAPLHLKVLVYDPFLSPDEATVLGVEKVSLEELFRRSDAVSLHTPLTNETRGMIRGEHISSMKPGATFINTARGAVVRQDELIEEVRRRSDLQFVLDVTDPEPPSTDCPLFDLPNVVVTPHIAGSAGGECRRMGQFMVEELERYMAGIPLKWAVVPDPVQAAVAKITPVLTTFTDRFKPPLPVRQPG